MVETIDIYDQQELKELEEMEQNERQAKAEQMRESVQKQIEQN